MIHALVCAGAGFLLAVLWFDLMFDLQALRAGRGVLPEPVLASIASYYRRVTTEARPMNRLVAAAMLALLAGLVAQVLRAAEPPWANRAALALAAAPIALAALRIVPRAVRLGARADDAARQSELARSIAREHVACFVAILGVLALQVFAS